MELHTQHTANFWKQILIATSLVLGLLFAACFPHAQAQDDAEFSGIDILFLVDQSGSMGGPAYGANPDDVETANDPLDLRFGAVQYALETLGDYRRTLAPDLDIRMAVINFGDSPELPPVLDWTTIAAGDDWDTARTSLIAQLSADTFKANHPDRANLGNTNFVSAFESAQQTFVQLPPLAGSETHLRVIVILTDGEPCVPGSFACGNDVAEQAHMDELVTLVQAAFPMPDYQVYALALDASGELWKDRQTDWERVTRVPDHAVQVTSDAEIGQVILQILNSLVTEKPPVVIVPGEPVAVPPYQQELRLSLFKSSHDPGSLQIQQPDASALVPGDPRLSISDQTRPIEVWKITTPMPGNWVFQLSSPDDRLNVYLELIPIQAQAEVPPTRLLPFESTTFNIRLTAGDGNPLPSYPAPYTLNVEATITAPDGTAQTLPLTELVSGMYEASTTVQQSGEYVIGLKAVSQYPDGSPFIVYQSDRIGSLSVGSYQFQAVSQLPGGDYLVGETVSVAATLLDEAGQPVTAPTLAIQAELVGLEPSSSALYPMASRGDGAFETTIPLMNPGTFKVSIRATLGDTADTMQVIGELTSNTLTVLPSLLVQLRLIEPEGDIALDATHGFPPFTPTTQEVVFETVVAEDNAPVNIYDIAADPASVLAIEVTDADGKTITPALETDPTTGRYRFQLEDLKPGTWTVQASLSGELSERYIIDPAAHSASFDIDVARYWVIYPFWGIVGLAVVIVGTSGVLILRRQVVKHHHPCKGKLSIVKLEDYGQKVTPLLEVSLDQYNSNRIVLKGRRLPRQPRMTQVIIECDSDEMHQARRVTVTVKNRRQLLLDRRMMSPGSSYALQISKRRASTSAGTDDFFNGMSFSQEDITYEVRKDMDDPLGDFGGALF